MGRSKLLLPAIALMVATCYPPAARSMPDAAPSQSSSAGRRLADTQWRLPSFRAPGGESPVLEGTTITLKFGADGRAGGSGGCNSYGGEYREQGENLSFSQIIS